MIDDTLLCAGRQRGVHEPVRLAAIESKICPCVDREEFTDVSDLVHVCVVIVTVANNYMFVLFC